MSKNSKDRRPYVRPVRRLEIPEIHVKNRVILLVVFLTIALVAFGVGIHSALYVEPGWQEVTVNAGERNVAGDFQLMYDFSEDGSGATARMKQLQELYTESAERAYQVFNVDEVMEGVGNLASLNAHVNETVTVEPELYRALEQVVSIGNRHVFLAPAYVEYDRIFSAEGDGEAAIYDPEKNPELSAYLHQVAAFASDPDSIRLELLGENQVILRQSEEYRAFCEQEGIESFVDFGWMTNAFVADYLAEQLLAQDFTKGYLASQDGFTRNLDSRQGSYTLHWYAQPVKQNSQPETVVYQGPKAVVSLRNFPLSVQERWQYYIYEDETVVSGYLGTQTGMTSTAVTSLLALSDGLTCGEMVLQLAPVFAAEDWTEESVQTILNANMECYWCKDGEINRLS